jgi:glyoxylase-like metal-dependent hydrolase (beta-lactamase superfamily II)
MIRPREIAPDIAVFPATTPTLPPATHTNSYALGGREVLIVEPATPFEDEQRAFIEWVRGLAAQGRRPVALFVTHHHADHVGGAEVLSRELALPLWGHSATEQRLQSSLRADFRLDRLLSEGDTLVLQGPRAQRWSVLHTPGHAPGHLCLHDSKSGYVVVGDMVASVGTILIEPYDGDMTVYLEQLRRLADLRAHCALPAHGEPILEPTRFFLHYVSHRLMRQDKVLGALRAAGAEGATPDELLPIVYDDTPRSAWPLGLLSLQAHLQKLRAEGRAAERDGIFVAC